MSLELVDAVRREGSALLIRGVSLTVPPGEVVAVVGPNGAGKSTTLRLLAGELAPTVGRARMDGVDLGRLSPREQARRRAVVPQHSDLGFDFLVLDVVLMGRLSVRASGTRGEDERIARRALETVGLAQFGERSYLSCSGGERQRIHIARALAQLDAPVDGRGYFLLDEPTSALDLRYQHALLRLMQDKARDGFGVLIVLHDLNLALRYAHRTVVLKDGQVLANGLSGDVLTTSTIEQAFGVQTAQAHVGNKTWIWVS
jgi:iron complex transport system ATP-binding protein